MLLWEVDIFPEIPYKKYKTGLISTKVMEGK